MLSVNGKCAGRALHELMRRWKIYRTLENKKVANQWRISSVYEMIMCHCLVASALCIVRIEISAMMSTR
jgi:hypothetical protein